MSVNLNKGNVVIIQYWLLWLLVPDLDVTWLVTPTGMLEVFWQRKVSSFEESNKVRLTLTGGNLTREFFGDGLGVVATGLKFGATYEMTLEDASESGERFGPVTIEACKTKR